MDTTVFKMLSVKCFLVVSWGVQFFDWYNLRCLV